MNEGFTTALDIGNRALQHVGATRISSFDEDSKNAAAVRFAYDKARKAELRRNTWLFSIRTAAIRPFDTDTLLLAPAAWSAVIVYQPGTVVSHDGSLWTSTIPFNVNREPGVDVSWDIYFGPLMAAPWDEDVSYYAGELTYIGQMAGLIGVYSSVPDSNEDDPTVVTTWDATTTFAKGNIVVHESYYYQSLIDLNLNFTPGAFDAFNLFTTYAMDEVVAGEDGLLYLSKADGNLGNPVTDTDWWSPTGGHQPWTPFFMGSTTSNKWVRQRGTTDIARPVYPLGVGPMSGAGRNLFRLPNGFLRMADQHPMARGFSQVGGPGNVGREDWVLENNYLVSAETSLVIRFVADVAVVSKMDSMFCEALAARVGMAICEELTQSASKMRMVTEVYANYISEARMVNGIETGPIEPEEDDFVAVRR